MALFNYATRELSAKIVYYGPGLSGKTTNIEKVHELLKPGQKGKLISLPTETDRTLFFDFLPVQLGKIKGFNVRFHLYTVPGQVFYNATRRLVLQGVDGVVFVADSQEGMKESNLESLRNLEENLASYGKKLEELPFLIQFNKRDLKKVQTVEEMNGCLNRLKVPTCEASALTGQGVIETLSSVSRLVFQNLRRSLLLPGENAAEEVEEKIGETFGPSPSPPPAGGTTPTAAAGDTGEELEEIADIEEIPAGGEPYPPPPDPFPSRFGEAIPFPAEEEGDAVPDEVEFAEGGGGTVPPPAADYDHLVPDEVEFGEGGEVKAALPPDHGGGEAAPAGEAYRFDELDEIEIQPPTPESLAPPPAEAPPTEVVIDPAATAWLPPGSPLREEAPVPRIGVEPEEGSSLTFMRFDPPGVDPEGSAVLPMVFLDGDGNTVRVRLRISMERR